MVCINIPLDYLLCDVSEFLLCLCEYFWSQKIMRHMSFDFYCISIQLSQFPPLLLSSVSTHNDYFIASHHIRGYCATWGHLLLYYRVSIILSRIPALFKSWKHHIKIQAFSNTGTDPVNIDKESQPLELEHNCIVTLTVLWGEICFN